jgi:hypothetical protein
VPNTIPALIGLWKRKYYNNSSSAGIGTNINYYFKQDGLERVYKGTDTISATEKGNGIWVLQAPTDILCEYKYGTVSTSFFFSKNYCKLNLYRASNFS